MGYTSHPKAYGKEMHPRSLNLTVGSLRGRALLSYQRKLAMSQRIEAAIILPGSIPSLSKQYDRGYEQL